jgi:trehalose 6-phosphate phosphatase
MTPFPDNFQLSGMHCLFLDVDGTLLDFAPDPQSVVVDRALLALLRRLERACYGALALISGRPIVDLDRLFQPLFLPATGVHGFERRNAEGDWSRKPHEREILTAVRHDLVDFIRMFPGTHIEDKGCAIAFHYRNTRQLEDRMRLQLANMLSPHSATLELLEGNQVIEIKPKSFNQADAIEAFMQEPPFHGCKPIYLADTADPAGFDVVRRFDGHAIAVGDRKNAEHSLADPPQVRHWLASVLPIIL